MNKTIIVQIGNTDNKLTQQEWSSFVDEIKALMCQYEVHFFGGSPNWECWQNVAWCILTPESLIIDLCMEITRVRLKYKQDSAAVTIGDTKFI